VRVLGHCGGEIPQVAKGILWAAGLPVENAPINPNPADVINLSLVAPIPCYFALEDAITRAIAAGAVVVASAGNQSLDAERAAPANCGGVITVAAGSTTGTTSSYSNYGSLVEVVAPGDGIYSTVDLGYQSPSGQPGYAPYWGTSMAAPMVSGLAALYLAAHPGATVAETVAAIIASATPIASCVEPFTCGAGLVSAARLIPPPPPFVSPTDFAIVADPLMAKVLESALSAHRGKLLPVGRGDLRVVVNDCVLTPPMSIEEGFEQLLSGAVCAPAAVSAS
jgi:serine protease